MRLSTLLDPHQFMPTASAKILTGA